MHSHCYENLHVDHDIQGSYPFSETVFQDSDFSKSPKCTIIEAINPYKIEIQK